MNRKCAITGAIAFESRLMVSPGAALPATAPAAKKPETVSLARRRAATHFTFEAPQTGSPVPLQTRKLKVTLNSSLRQVGKPPQGITDQHGCNVVGAACPVARQSV